ncbi:MAG TPA: hypothetical protein VF929_03690 [Gemmatimonadaceae bacterium]
MPVAPRRLHDRIAVFLTTVAMGGLGACTIPTDAPVTDTRWVVPAQTTRIAVDKYLPNGVTVAPDSSGFLVSVPGATVTRTLGQDCAQCTAANGLTAPKPAFVGSASISTSVPTDIVSATITGGALAITVQNNYTFDPLRPSPSNGVYGYAVIIASNGNTVIGKDSINGATTAMPSGGTLSRTIPLSGTVTGSFPVTISVTINSPAGDPVLIDASRTISVSVAAQSLKVASANVVVSNKSLTSSSTLNFRDIDQTIINHVLSGTLLLTISNPFNATGTLTVTLTPEGGAPIVRPIQLLTGTSTPTIAFSQSELQSLLGHVVTVSYTGTVNATSGSVSVSPKQAVVVQARLDLTLELGTPKQ